ncbi:MAG: hypothetical protein WKF57_06025 [Nakamurella sp.]
MARKSITYRLEWDRSTTELLQAASIALGVLWHVKCTTVADLAEAVTAGDADTLRLMRELIIEPDAQALIEDDDITPILNLLRSRAHGGKVLTVAECPVCGEWFHPGAAALPAKCFLTSGCPGKPAKPAALRKIDIEAEAAELAAAAAAELEAAAGSERDEHEDPDEREPDTEPDPELDTADGDMADGGTADEGADGEVAIPDDPAQDAPAPDAAEPIDLEPIPDLPADDAPVDTAPVEPVLVDDVLVDDVELEGGDPFA